VSPALELGLDATDSSTVALTAPSVGIFCPTVDEGEVVTAGQEVGTLEVLGVRYALRVPPEVLGRVTARAGGGRARAPVEFGEVLLTLAVGSAVGISAPASINVRAKPESELRFVAPMSGRFYGRPAPTDEPFVAPGAEVTHGQTVGLLEVMKTFNRLVYQGDDVPETAIVDAVVPADGDDVVCGDPILLLRSDGDD